MRFNMSKELSYRQSCNYLGLRMELMNLNQDPRVNTFSTRCRTEVSQPQLQAAILT